MKRPPVVVIIQQNLAHYRVPFYEALRARLQQSHIRLKLVHAPPTADRVLRRDTVTLSWAASAPLRQIPLGRQALYWQSCPAWVGNADLVVVEQASKLLLNYVLLVRQSLGGPRVAFWGHGCNLKPHAASRVGETLKAFTSTRVHWWFAYNELSCRIVKALGYPPERITNIQNAIDTRELRDAMTTVSDAQVESLRGALNLRGGKVGLFIGSMYTEKRVDFLMDACRIIRRALPDFEMIWIGAGPDADRVDAACRATSWMHYVGPVFGLDRVPYFRLADLLLLPGLVGLAILDAFSLETPLVTTAVPYHSPEIEYLRPGVNGVMVEAADDAQAYAQAVIDLLRDDASRLQLADKGLAASRHYSIEEMASRFAAGIQHALADAS